jgi:phosphoribosyl 1,2-cyclic phosphate phosphodiesterase
MTSLRFLGTGWSHGVPVIGCDCPVCRTPLPRNIRRRPSVHIEHGPLSVVIDTGPDFRDQVLSFGLRHLDAVFITHQHADHVMGLDDVRRFTWTRESPLPVYADPDTLTRLRMLYPYVAPRRTAAAAAVPQVEFRPWTGTQNIGPLRFRSFPVPHGPLPCFGVRIDAPDGSIGYVPDCSSLPDAIIDILAGVDIMILNALRDTPHPSHLTLERSLYYLARISAPRSYLTHMGCPLDYYQLNDTLPPGVEMAWDGLQLHLTGQPVPHSSL